MANMNGGDAIMTDAPSTKPNLVGAKRFSLKKVLADTLQGRIYLAQDKNNNKQWVIVKECWKQLVKTGRSRDNHRVPEDFPKEKKIHLFLSNQKNCDQGFVQCLEEWEDENCFYLAMEYCEGGELFEYIRKMHTQGPMAKFISKVTQMPQKPAKDATANAWQMTVQKMFKQLVQSLDFMHKLGVCHLDMSLENTMLGDAKAHTTKIIDFGLAQKFENGFHYQQRVGKTGYMAPEVYGRVQYDPRAADIWSLGVMLFMMLIGAPPYEFPSRSNAAFNFMISGKLSQVLAHWRRLPLVTEQALDLMNRIFKPESQRITMEEIRKHPFVGLLQTPEVESDVDAAAQIPSTNDNKEDEDDDADMEDRPNGNSGNNGAPPNGGNNENTNNNSNNGGDTSGGSQHHTHQGGGGQTQLAGDAKPSDLKTHKAQEFAQQINPELSIEKLREIQKHIEAAINRMVPHNVKPGEEKHGQKERPEAGVSHSSTNEHGETDDIRDCVRELKHLDSYLKKCMAEITAPKKGQETADKRSSERSSAPNSVH